MMHDAMEGRTLTPREARKVERNEAERAMRDWLRAAAADRRPDGVHGGPFWYLIRVRHGSEWKTAAELRRWGIRAWCPRRRAVEKRGGGKGKRIVRRTICPGYLFVELAPCAHAVIGVLSFADRVLGFVGSGERPYQVSAEDIDALRGAVAHFPSKRDGGDSLFRRGMLLMIKDGPFAGFEGQVERADNARGRLKVEVDMLGRLTMVELELDQVRGLG